MKYKSREYVAKDLRGNSELADRAETIQGIKDIIDRSNERAQALGYKPSSRLIVSVEYESEYTDDGIFLMSKTVRKAYQVYPARID